ncbi:MAG: hypothetical protein R3F31_03475 [Verrucomicrobiales bacterium]
MDTGIPPLSQENDTPAERFRCCFRWMLLARLLEERIARLYRAGKIVGGFYLGRGRKRSARPWDFNCVVTKGTFLPG